MDSKPWCKMDLSLFFLLLTTKLDSSFVSIKGCSTQEEPKESQEETQESRKPENGKKSKRNDFEKKTSRELEPEIELGLEPQTFKNHCEKNKKKKMSKKTKTKTTSILGKTIRKVLQNVLEMYSRMFVSNSAKMTFKTRKDRKKTKRSSVLKIIDKSLLLIFYFSVQSFLSAFFLYDIQLLPSLLV
jgi:hypothetical protein